MARLSFSLSTAFMTMALVAFIPSVSGQNLHYWEMGVDVETTSYLRIYDGEGCQLYPDITIDRCNEEMFTYYQINPTQFSPDWCAQFSGDSGPCVKWNYEWETDLITLEFSTSASEADVIARYVYVSGPDTSDQTFYRPSSSAGSSDIVFWVVVEDNETLVKAKDGSNYYEDVFANGYVLPYDLSYYCQDTTSSPCPTGSITHIGYFLSPVAYVPSSTSGRTFTFAAEGTARVFEEWTTTWDIPNLTLRFPQGRKLIVEGELEADGVTFTEAASEQGWGGVAVYSGGTLDFDGVTVSDAEVGVDVYSTGNTFTNSFFTGNGVGIRSAYEQNYCPGLEACLIGDRSSFTLDQSCVTGSEYDPIDGLDYGYGVWARGTDALITATTVEGNDAYGLRLDDADVAARRLLLTENGTGSMFFPDGARALSNGDLTLASYFEGFPDRGGVALGLNSIRDNEDHEISLQDGYTTVGLVCSLTFCPDANRISESDFPGDFSLLIDNDTKEIIQAYRTYWATTPADPPDAAFLRPERVEDFQALTSDPAASAGRPGGCVAPSRPSDTAATTRGMLGGEAGRGEGLDAETAAWLRAQMHQMRQALAAEPGADGAAERLRVLYALQRLDRADVLGEHTATAALLRTLYAPLAGGEVPPALRATAEAALTASLHDALRHGAYTEARALVADLGERVEGADARQALALVAVALDEQAGDVESAAEAVLRQAVVPSVATIRRRFDERRQRKQPPLQRLLHRARRNRTQD